MWTGRKDTQDERPHYLRKDRNGTWEKSPSVLIYYFGTIILNITRLQDYKFSLLLPLSVDLSLRPLSPRDGTARVTWTGKGLSRPFSQGTLTVLYYKHKSTQCFDGLCLDKRLDV